MTLQPKNVIRLYCQRGHMENFIKEAKNGFACDKMSSPDFAANAVKLQIAMLAYNFCVTSRNLMVATSKPTVFAQQILKHFGIEQFFDRIVGSNLDGTRSKKEIVEYTMRQYSDLAKDDFVMIGVREHDIIRATGNGIDSMGVTYGYGSREELTQAKATYIAETVEDLHKLLSC